MFDDSCPTEPRRPIDAVSSLKVVHPTALSSNVLLKITALQDCQVAVVCSVNRPSSRALRYHCFKVLVVTLWKLIYEMWTKFWGMGRFLVQ